MTRPRPEIVAQTSRAERRRTERQMPKINPSRPLADVVIWTGNGMPAFDCIASLPDGCMPITCNIKDGSPPVARNKAALRGTAPFIIFMDADATFIDGAKLALAFEALSTGAAVVGPLVLLSGETVFSAGYAFNIEGRPFYRFNRWSVGAEKVMRRREDLQAVPFPCLITRRDIWRVTPFHGEYGELAFADAHYCIEARRKGRVVYEPGIQVRCEGGLIERPSDAAVMLIRSAGVSYDELGLLA